MFRRSLRRLALIALLLPAGAVVAAAENTVVDATGASVTVHDTGRIVSVGGAVTEVVFALGFADNVVAVDSTSQFPRAVTEKPDVGYMRRLSAEPILGLAPSVVLAVEDAGPETALNQLRESGVPVVLVPDDPSYDGVLKKIELIAAALDVEEKGRQVTTTLRADFDRLNNAVDSVGKRPKVLFLLSIGQGGAPLAGGRDTSADGIIRLAGGVNAVDAFESFKPLSPEAAVLAAPDVLLVTNRTLELLGGKAGLLGLPEISLTPAAQQGRVVAIDGLLLLGFGPRTGQAVRTLAAELHPDLALPTVRSE